MPKKSKSELFRAGILIAVLLLAAIPIAGLAAGCAELASLRAGAAPPRPGFSPGGTHHGHGPDLLGRVTDAAGVVGSILPEPARSLVLTGVGGLALLRANQHKRGLASVARGIHHAARDDEEFRACFRRHAAEFRSVQTPLARRVIDETTKDRFMMRLPV